MLTVAALCGGSAEGQQPPTVEPGSVATVPVAVAAPDGHAAARADFRVVRPAGVRLFGSDRGTVPVEGDSAVVALTFQASEELPAGTRRVAELVVSWADARADTVAVRVDVAARHRVEAAFVTTSATVAPGRDAEIGYRVANRGNAADTVRLDVERGRASGWRLDPRRSHVALPPGREDTVRVRVRAPSGARAGGTQRLRMVARGRRAEAADELTLHVVEGGGPIGGLEHLPAHVFVGSSTSGRAGSGPGVVASLRADGTVGRDTDVLLEGRYRPDDHLVPRPLRTDMGGPEFRLRLRRPEWRAAAGDVFARSDPLAGTLLAGRGADVVWEGGDYFGEVFAAVPRTGPGEGGGRSVVATGGVELEDGRLGVVASDHRLPPRAGIAGGTTRSVGGRLELGSRSGRMLRLEAGAMALDPESGPGRAGPAAEGELWLSGEEGHLNVRGRLVPGQLSSGPTLSDELFVAGLKRLDGGPLHAVGRASLASGDPVGAGRGGDFRRAEAGLRYAPRGLRLEGRLRLEEADVSFPSPGERRRRTAVLSADAPLGPFTADARVEVGHEASPRRDGVFRRLRGTLRWQHASGWGLVAAGDESDVVGGARRYVEAEGGWELGRTELAAGASLEGGGFGGVRVTGWSRAAYRVSDGLSVVAGVERDALSLTGEAWSVSVGIRQGLDLPLPVPERPVSEGVVFEDRDGDGRRDPGEEGLPGVRVRKGFVEVTTDRRGRFRVDQEAVRRRPLDVDPSTLPDGAIVTPGADVPREGEAEIPVMRTARLVLEVFVDRDGDGRRDDGEPPASEAVVTAVDGRGGERVFEADPAGRVVLGGLPPGPYTLRVRRPETRRRLAVEEEIELELAAGTEASRAVPLEPSPRPVR